jgi:hypothetical protein
VLALAGLAVVVAPVPGKLSSRERSTHEDNHLIVQLNPGAASTRLRRRLCPRLLRHRQPKEKDEVKKIALSLALAAGIMMAAAGNASAQIPQFPPLPDIPTGEAPTAPHTPSSTVKPASKVAGTTVRWSRSARKISVRVSCPAASTSGVVILTKYGDRIGRKEFRCSASRTTMVVQVRITRAANRKLRGGVMVTARVNSASQTHAKRLRVVRAAALPTARASLAATAADQVCSDYYVSSTIGMQWQTSTAWYESVCAYSGFYGSHLADVWNFYYWTTGGYWAIYGTWRRYHQDGCFVWWNVADLRDYGPYCPQ